VGNPGTEQRTLNPRVRGSSPWRRTRRSSSLKERAGVKGVSACGFTVLLAFAGHGGMASRLLSPDRCRFRASRRCGSRTGPGPAAFGGAAGVLDAPAGEPIMAGQGEGRRPQAGGMALRAPHRRAVRLAGLLAAFIPSGVPRPGWPGGMGRSVCRPGGANHIFVPAAGCGGEHKTWRPRARAGRQLMLPVRRRGGGARRAGHRRPR
jgi:hypothetical protein